MNAGVNKPAPPSKMAQTGQGFSAGKQASILLEKGNPGLRRATPDSEALASSDDETDHGMSSSMVSNPPVSKPARRTSWLSEIPSTKRKPSLTFGGPISPTSSHPATPPADSSAWSSAGQVAPGSAGRNHPPQPSFPWGSGIWNETKREVPARLQEVLPSPNTAQTNASFLSDEFTSPPSSRGTIGDSSFPLPIPLHPTPKTYRSQSYSVGQLEQDQSNPNMPNAVGSRAVGRGRAPQYTNLQHRPSRPSVLGELGHDSGVLGRVREDEDGEEEDPNQVQTQVPWDMGTSRLGHHSKDNHSYRPPESPFRNRTMSSTSAASHMSNTGAPPRPARLYGTGMPEPDDVLDDLDESGEFSASGPQAGYGRRYSEQYSDTARTGGHSQVDNRTLENVRKAHWQTSLGWGSIQELPQSRRHSFADIPTRHGSMSSEHQPSLLGLSPRLAGDEHRDTSGMYAEDNLISSRGDNSESEVSFNPNAPAFVPNSLEEQRLSLEYLHNRDYAASYFSGEASLRNNARALHQPYGAHNPFGRGQQHAMARHEQPLFVVTFKAQRADVFYIQEDTGLEVKDGDLVIVEADRGTDLGTVAAANVSWDDARAIKARLSEEHYRWLMLFSRHGQAGGAGASTTANMSGGSAVGGMGPPGTHGLQEPQSGELKPKLIKRLAQNHEIQTLRDKEGNEAKAKRVCQQKVAEHRLNMEILDAEFQMDWKKLTFYYFADSYINFNSLVTDLFKIYKTRIWMSAINPDSFISPPNAGMTLPSPIGLGTGNTTAGRDSPADRRRQLGMQGQPSSGTFMGEMNDPNRSNFNPAGARGYAPTAYPTMSMGLQPGLRTSGYPQAMQQQADPFSPYLGGPYASMGHLPEYPLSAGAANRSGRPAQPAGEDWANNFQGLSLGS